MIFSRNHVCGGKKNLLKSFTVHYQILTYIPGHWSVNCLVSSISCPVYVWQVYMSRIELKTWKPLLIEIKGIEILNIIFMMKVNASI